MRRFTSAAGSLLFLWLGCISSLVPVLLADSLESAPTAKPHKPTLTLEATKQARLGLAQQTLVATNLPSETAAYGTVLDPAPLALLDAELEGAEAALGIARLQEERERVLFEQNQIVSRPVLEAAQLQVRAGETRFETAQRRLATEWGEPFLELNATNRHALVRRLLRRELVLLRVELPGGESPANPPPSARLVALGADHDRPGTLFSEAPTVDARTQGRAFLFQAPGPDPVLRPGMAVTAFLPTPGPARAGSLLPVDGIVRHLGHAWVYVATGDDGFEREPVTLDQRTGDGWFTAAQFPPGTRIVTTGAALLLSEELKSQLTAE